MPLTLIKSIKVRKEILKMKKIIIALTLALAMLLPSCVSEDTTNEPTDTTTEAQTTAPDNTTPQPTEVTLNIGSYNAAHFSRLILIILFLQTISTLKNSTSSDFRRLTIKQREVTVTISQSFLHRHLDGNTMNLPRLSIIRAEDTDIVSFPSIQLSHLPYTIFRAAVRTEFLDTP